MEKEIIKLWEENKHNLKEYISNIKQQNFAEYKELIRLLIVYILNANGEIYDENKITMIDNGDYQGTLLFLIPKKTYQPSITEYLITYIDYGSCTGCDTLKRIHEDKVSLFPTKTQINDYMTVFLHLIQKMKHIYDKEIDFDECACEEEEKIYTNSDVRLIVKAMLDSFEKNFKEILIKLYEDYLKER